MADLGATVFIGTETGVWQRPATQLTSIEQTDGAMAPRGFCPISKLPQSI